MMTHLSRPLVLALILIILHPTELVQGQSIAQDCSVVSSIWTKMGGTPAISSTSCCSAAGLLCSSTRVTQVSWYQKNLKGSIPPEIGNLTALTFLDLSYNQLTGSIPSTIGNLANLQKLYIYLNQLTGSIPSTIGNLVSLQSLALYNNLLSGSIPSSMSNLANLYSLYLNKNQLNGTIPSTLGNLTSLGVLDLSYNNLPPPLPIQLTQFQNLNILNLDGNPLLSSKVCSLRSSSPQPDCPLALTIYKSLGGYATIPSDALTNCCGWNGIQCSGFDRESCIASSSFGSWQTLRVTGLNWERQNLRGSISPSITNLTYLQSLNLRDNSVTGAIPLNLPQMINLAWIDLGNNLMSGSIPTGIGNLKNLTKLSLSKNYFSGAILAELGSLTLLRSLELNSNQFTGPIPNTLQNLGALINFQLDDNLLTGTIPSSIGNLKSLLTLSLSGNLLSGSIPSNLGSLTNLTYFSLASNQITGSIPSELGGLINLQFLYLHQNNLNGTIPTSFGQMNQLVQLFLSNNFLSGTVPSQIGNLNLLVALRLDSNNLTGVPSSLSSLTNSKTVLLPNPMTLVPYDLLSRNPSFTFRDTDWASYLSYSPLSKRQITSSQGNLTTDQLLALCPLNNVQSADVPAGCIAGLYNKYCLDINTEQKLSICQSMYSKVFSVSIFNSIGAVCPAWKYGPRSLQCAQAVKSFSYQLPYILVTSDMAANLTANILGSTKYAPCYNTGAIKCSW